MILGASGFVGNAIYKELCSYFDTYGTYCSNRSFANNKQFVRYDMEEDDIFRILEHIKPDIIVSSLRGNFPAQIQAHHHLMEYLVKADAKLYFISSANVFDAYSKFPSYEHDKTLSLSVYGRLKIKIEEIKENIENNEPIEVFPNLIINVTNDDRLTQQIHYLINRNKTGIFHLGSSDLIHHEEFIKEVIEHLGNYHPIYKRVYTTNEDRYLAALPKDNILPKNLRISCQEIIDHHLPV